MLKHSSIVFALLAITASIARLTASNNPIHIDGGLIADMVADTSGVRAFKGIPFAAPPVGNLRWKEPQPVVPWTGVRRADMASKTCVQMGYQPGSFYEREFYRQPAPTSRTVST